MPLGAPLPPDGLLDALAAYVQALAVAPGRHFLTDVPRDDLELVAPHRVYTLTLSAVRDQQLSGAHPTAWRFLLVSETEIIGSAEIGTGGAQSLTVTADRFAASTAAAIKQLENIPEVQADEFELRLLKLNSAYLWAAWLVGDKQIIVPLDPAPPFVRAGQLYTEAAFADAVTQPSVKPFDPPVPP